MLSNAEAAGYHFDGHIKRAKFEFTAQNACILSKQEIYMQKLLEPRKKNEGTKPTVQM